MTTMNQEPIEALVERIVADAERSLGRQADAGVVYRRAAEAVWDWWQETASIPTCLARSALIATGHAIARRKAAAPAAIAAAA
jgi:hypothetical protein